MLLQVYKGIENITTHYPMGYPMKEISEKENCKALSFSDTNIKHPLRKLTNWIQQHFKKIWWPTKDYSQNAKTAWS